MSEIFGLEALTIGYLGRDWQLFGSTVDDAIRSFGRDRSAAEVASAVAGLEQLLASSMTEDELDDRWIMGFGSGYDPRDDGFTYREWFAHALELLRREADANPA